MRVHRRGQALHRGFRGLGGARFGDHFRRLVADDVRAEQFAVLLVEDELDQALVLTGRDRFAVRAEGKKKMLSTASNIGIRKPSAPFG